MTVEAKAIIQNRYDRFAGQELSGGSYEPLNQARIYFRTRKLQTALRLGAFPQGSRLLDVGCSVGQYCFPLAEQGFRVSGVDLSPNAIEVGRRRAAARGLAMDFAIGDAERLTVPDGTFDGVLSFSTLRYVPSLGLALTEIRRVLRPGGRAVLDFPNRWCPWFYVKQWIGSEQHPHDHWFTRRGVEAALRQAGFTDIRISTLLFTPTVTPDRLIPAFRAIDWVGERLPGVSSLAGILMASARKP